MSINVLTEYKQHNDFLIEQVKEKNKENNELRQKVERYEKTLRKIAESKSESEATLRDMISLEPNNFLLHGEIIELEYMLSFADLTLLSSFKNGSEGQDNFYKFMRLVRNLKQESDEQETYIKLLQQEVIEMRDSADYDRGRD